ncbi:MAG: J domain-containing protein [Alphaproteobacteria bacterium]
MPFLDYYKVLDITQSASATEIRKAYRKLMKSYHPDANNSQNIVTEEGKEIRQKVQNAYEILGDEEKRKKYNIEYDNVQKNRIKKKNNTSEKEEFTNIENDLELFETYFKMYHRFKNDPMVTHGHGYEYERNFKIVEEIAKSLEKKTLTKDEEKYFIAKVRVEFPKSHIYKRHYEIIMDNNNWLEASKTNNELARPILRFPIDDEKFQNVQKLENFLNEAGIEVKFRYSKNLKSSIIEISGEKNIRKFKNVQLALKEHFQDRQILDNFSEANQYLNKRFSSEEITYLTLQTKLNLEKENENLNRTLDLFNPKDFLKQFDEVQNIIYFKIDNLCYKDIEAFKHYLYEKGVEDIQQKDSENHKNSFLIINNKSDVKKVRKLLLNINLEEINKEYKKSKKVEKVQDKTEKFSEAWFEENLKKFSSKLKEGENANLDDLTKQEKEDYKSLREIQKGQEYNKSMGFVNIDAKDAKYFKAMKKLGIKEEDFNSVKKDSSPNKSTKKDRSR